MYMGTIPPPTSGEFRSVLIFTGGAMAQFALDGRPH